MPPPMRMANSDVRICLHRGGAAQPVDSVTGAKLRLTGGQWADPIILRGQPRFSRVRDEAAKMSGNSPETNGYVTFSRDVLEAAGITNPVVLEHARITGFRRRGAWEDVDLLVLRADHRGHLTEGPILVKIYFTKQKDLIGAR